MFSILSKLNVYGSPPEVESDHCWVAVINEATDKGFFVLAACCRCGMLARKLNSNTWESSRASSDQWRIYSVEECPGTLEEIDY